MLQIDILLKREDFTMRKIDKRIQDVLGKGEKVLVSGVPVGYPNLDETRKLVEVYIRSGMDVVEFSMPTRNPYIDTQVIASSNVKALDLEPDLHHYFETLHIVRQDFPDEPFYMMAYADLIMQFGLKNFVEQLVELEIDGVELPDKDEMVPELASEMETLFDQNGIYRIYILHHPYNDTYFMGIKDKAAGFLLLQAIADEEGNRPIVDPENETLIAKVKKETDIPVILGYGIKNAERVKEAVALGADGVLVGTSMVEYINHGDYTLFSQFIRGLKEATRNSKN
jgi:tryptophan synthase alpha chain